MLSSPCCLHSVTSPLSAFLAQTASVRNEPTRSTLALAVFVQPRTRREAQEGASTACCPTSRRPCRTRRSCRISSEAHRRPRAERSVQGEPQTRRECREFDPLARAAKSPATNVLHPLADKGEWVLSLIVFDSGLTLYRVPTTGRAGIAYRARRRCQVLHRRPRTESREVRFNPPSDDADIDGFPSYSHRRPPGKASGALSDPFASRTSENPALHTSGLTSERTARPTGTTRRKSFCATR